MTTAPGRPAIDPASSTKSDVVFGGAVIRAVAFDLDDTLLDHGGAARLGIRSWLERRGIVCDDDLGDVWMAIEDEHYRAHQAGLLGFQEQRRRRIAAIMQHVGIASIPDDDDALDALFLDYLTTYADSWRAFDGVADVIKRLRDMGLGVGLLTNGNREQQEDKLRRIGLSETFDVVLCMNDVPAPKPSALAFAALADALGLPAPSVVYVGDHLDYDVAGAIEAGMHAVWLDRTGCGDCPEGAHRIATLDDLVNLIGT